MAQSRESSMYEMMKYMAIGSIAGATEVMIDHPLWTIKTLIQKKKEPVKLDPRILYRGIIPNMVSTVPIYALQFGANSAMKSIVDNQYAAAVMSGACTAFIACPIEMIMTHQGDTGASFAATYKKITYKYGVKELYHGLSATMFRDGIFTLAMFSGKSILRPYIPNDTVATITAGMIAAVVTQSADVIKTRQQAGQQSSITAVARNLYQESGILGFFKGGLPRCARIASAVMIIGNVTEGLSKKF